MFGFCLYMFKRFIVALSLNCEPFFPPEGSGLLGLVDDLLWEKADPFFPDYFALKTSDDLVVISRRFVAATVPVRFTI